MKTIKNTLYLGAIASMAMSFTPQAYAESSMQHKPHGDQSATAMDESAPATMHTQIQDLKYLQHTENKYICMVNNKRFDKVQIPTEVNGKTYYGCCSMCKAKLEKSQELREAIDPISGNVIDKASAVIGTGPDGVAYYFENEENMRKFDVSQAHDKSPQDNHKH